MKCRSFTQSVGVLGILACVRRVFARVFPADARELEMYVNRVVDNNIVPILSLGEDGLVCPVPVPSFPYVAGDLRYVANGVCREFYDFQRDAKFGVAYPLWPPWGRPPANLEAMLFGDMGEVLVERPSNAPRVRKEVVRPHECAKLIKISEQEFLALDNDPAYLYG